MRVVSKSLCTSIFTVEVDRIPRRASQTPVLTNSNLLVRLLLPSHLDLLAAELLHSLIVHISHSLASRCQVLSSALVVHVCVEVVINASFSCVREAVLRFVVAVAEILLQSQSAYKIQILGLYTTYMTMARLEEVETKWIIGRVGAAV